MRKLHLVGFTSDRKGLIFSARRGSKSGGFVVALEDGLIETVTAEQRRAEGGDAEAHIDDLASGADRHPRQESTLTPREMQARLRAGRSIAEVAAEAEVDPEWVERFAVPILAEQAQIVELARTLTYNKSRRGPSAEPLGPSVAENLIDRSVVLMDDAFDAAWTANQLHDVVWAVHLRYRSRGRDQEATWEVNVATGQLTSRNRLASTLGYVDERQRRSSRRQPGRADDEVPEPDQSRRSGTRPATSPSRRRPRGASATTAGASVGKSRSRAPAPTRARAARSTTAKAQSPTRVTRAMGSKATKATKATKGTRATPGTAKATKATGATKAAKKARPTKAAKASKTAKKAKPTKAAKKAKPTKAEAAREPRGPRMRSTATQAAVADAPRLRIGTDGSPLAGAVGNGRPSAARGSDGASAAAPSRVPINRLANTRVAASRAAAGRLSGDRRAANPVPSAVDAPVLPDRRPRPATRQAPATSAPATSDLAGPDPEPLGLPDFMMPPATSRPAADPPAPEPVADDGHFGKAGGPSEPPGLLQFDDLLESVDFDDPAKAYPGPGGSRGGANRSPGSVPTDSTITRIPRPLSAWPMGAG